jgi:hypothetical protein
MMLHPTAGLILAEQRQQERLAEAARWRLVRMAEATCVEQCGWRWSDVRAAFSNLVRIAFSWLVGSPSRTGTLPATGQQSLWQA